MKDNDYIELIAEAVACDAAQIADIVNLADLPRWDSMAVVSFLAECDSRLGTAPSAKEVARCKTVAELIALAKTKRSE